LTGHCFRGKLDHFNVLFYVVHNSVCQDLWSCLYHRLALRSCCFQSI